MTPLIQNAVVIETLPPIKNCIIFLHGLGADGHNFAYVLRMLNLTQTRFILPHAPKRPITRNYGEILSAWYDLYGLHHQAQQDEAGVKATAKLVHDLIDEQITKGVSSKRIALGGFSQGGAMALYAGLSYSNQLAGIIALSTYVPIHNKFEQDINEAQKQTPIFLAHGIDDEIISMETASLSHEALKTWQLNVQWREYRMAHQVILEEVADIKDFIHKIFNV